MSDSLMPQEQTVPLLPERQRIITLSGKQVALGPLTRDLIPIYQKWNNDLAVTRTCGSQRPTTLEQETDAYDRVVRDESLVFFTVYEQPTLRPIGNAYLTNIDHRNRTAEYGIVIGESECRGKGYGTEATRLVLDFAFNALSLHNIWLEVYDFNEAGLRAYKKAGFRLIGRRRQSHLIGGSLCDKVYLECLSTEFTSPMLRSILLPTATL